MRVDHVNWISIYAKEITHISLSPPLVFGSWEVSWSGLEESPYPPCWHPDLGLPPSRTEGSTFLLFVSIPVWHLVTAAQRAYSEHWEDFLICGNLPPKEQRGDVWYHETRSLHSKDGSAKRDRREFVHMMSLSFHISPDCLTLDLYKPPLCLRHRAFSYQLEWSFENKIRLWRSMLQYSVFICKDCYRLCGFNNRS